MEEVREIAKSYYEASSREVQGKAKEWFRSMDGDGNGKVDLEEFLRFMRSQGYSQMQNNSFFKMLDATDHGRLDFMDVMTLYYIIKSDRPFCNCCGEFIPSTFFSCLICFNQAKASFNICCACHKSKKCRHNHHGSRAPFLDNYTLLQTTRNDQVRSKLLSFCSFSWATLINVLLPNRPPPALLIFPSQRSVHDN